MRVYGSSPLYNYVELIFRCKRMFIVAVILGAVVSSVMVYTRPVSYNASMLVSLTGQSAVAGDIASSGDRNAASPAIRKASRLNLWLSWKVQPPFLEAVVQNAGLDKKYPHKTMDQLVEEVRTHLGAPTLLGDQYMQLSINWPNATEAEAILNALYSRFSARTVLVETEAASAKTAFLKTEKEAAEAKANELGRKRMVYLQHNFFEQPSMLSSLVGQIDLGQRQIEDASLDLHDAQSRLHDIDTQLQSIPAEITQSEIVKTETQAPDLMLKSQLQDLITQKNRLLQSYSPLHPTVVKVQSQIDALNQQIQQVNQNPAPTPTKSGTESTKSVNPEYQDLNQQRRELVRVANAQKRRVDELQRNLDLAKARAQKLPDQEVVSGKIDREYNLASTIRNNAEARLASAELEEQAEVDAKQKEVHLEVPPAAERADTGGKTVMLFALGPLMGIFIAFCFSLLVETLDHTLRTPVEVEKYLGKPVLAVIPKMKAPRGGQKSLPGSTTTSISS